MNFNKLHFCYLWLLAICIIFNQLNGLQIYTTDLFTYLIPLPWYDAEVDACVAPGPQTAVRVDPGPLGGPEVDPYQPPQSHSQRSGLLSLHQNLWLKQKKLPNRLVKEFNKTQQWSFAGVGHCDWYKMSFTCCGVWGFFTTPGSCSLTLFWCHCTATTQGFCLCGSATTGLSGWLSTTGAFTVIGPAPAGSLALWEGRRLPTTTI